MDARLFAKLYDVAPDGTTTLLRRQVAPARIPMAALDGPVSIRMVGTSWRFEAGHRVRLVLASTDLAYYNERLPDQLTVGSTPQAPSVLRFPAIAGTAGATPAQPPAPPEPPPPAQPAPAPALPATGGPMVLMGLVLLLIGTGLSRAVRR